jgi:hypothetical protein
MGGNKLRDPADYSDLYYAINRKILQYACYESEN